MDASLSGGGCDVCMCALCAEMNRSYDCLLWYDVPCDVMWLFVFEISRFTEWVGLDMRGVVGWSCCLPHGCL